MTTHANILPIYQQLRQAGRSLNHKLVETLSKETLKEGGRRLGILKDGILVFGSVDESAVLMDFCIYNVYRDGRNAVQRYLETSPPPAGSDEATILSAMQNAYYTILQVTGVERGIGVTVLDTLRDDVNFLADVGLSSSVPKGVLVAGRVLRFEGFLTTGGASLPITGASGNRVADVLERWGKRMTNLSRLTPDQEADLSASVIRACLETGASSHIEYSELGEAPSRSRRPDSGTVRAAPQPQRPLPLRQRPEIQVVLRQAMRSNAESRKLTRLTGTASRGPDQDSPHSRLTSLGRTSRCPGPRTRKIRTASSITTKIAR